MQPPGAGVPSTEGSVRMEPEPRSPDPSVAWDGPLPDTADGLAVVLDRYLDRLVRYAFRKLGNLEDAEDVVQDVFVRTFRRCTGRKKVSAAGPYLYRSVANACTDLLRKRSFGAVFREEVGIEQLLSQAEGPPEVAAATEQLRRAEQLLARLPDKQAEVIRLRVFDDLKLSEIAGVVGCSVNTVCSRLRYGFQKLRTLVPQGRE